MLQRALNISAMKFVSWLNHCHLQANVVVFQPCFHGVCHKSSWKRGRGSSLRRFDCLCGSIVPRWWNSTVIAVSRKFGHRYVCLRGWYRSKRSFLYVWRRTEIWIFLVYLVIWIFFILVVWIGVISQPGKGKKSEEKKKNTVTARSCAYTKVYFWIIITAPIVRRDM